MVEAILLVLLVFFAVMGICEAIYIIKMLFYYPCVRVKNIALVVLEEDYAISQLGFLWQKIKWQGDAFAVGIVAITDNLGVCEILKCKDFIIDKNIVLCNSQLLQHQKFLQGDL